MSRPLKTHHLSQEIRCHLVATRGNYNRLVFTVVWIRTLHVSRFSGNKQVHWSLKCSEVGTSVAFQTLTAGTKRSSRQTVSSARWTHFITSGSEKAHHPKVAVVNIKVGSPSYFYTDWSIRAHTVMSRQEERCFCQRPFNSLELWGGHRSEQEGLHHRLWLRMF